MAKAKPTNSPRHKRVQGVQPSSASRMGPSKKGPVRKGPTIRKKSRLPLYLVLGVLALLTMMIVGFVFVQRWQIAQESQTPGQGRGEPADATVLQEVTGVSPSTWESIGTGGVAQPLTPITGSHSLPEFLYGGGEYCPNCAAERWAMVVAFIRVDLAQVLEGAKIHIFQYYHRL